MISVLCAMVAFALLVIFVELFGDKDQDYE